MTEPVAPSLDSIHALLVRVDDRLQAVEDGLRRTGSWAQSVNERLHAIEDWGQTVHDRLRGIEDWVQTVNDRLRHLEAMSVESLMVLREHANRMDRLQLRLPPLPRTGAGIAG